ncbi:MAG: PsbP-related protein [FCB group bacterium]|jgi:hypothetical protein
MKKFSIFSLVILFLTLTFWSCSKKGDATEITGLTSYTDPLTQFSIKYPTNWFMQSMPGTRFLVFSTKTAIDRFIQYDPKGIAGAKIEVLMQKLVPPITLDTIMQKTKRFTSGYEPPQKVMIDGTPATKLVYTFELEDGEFNGEAYFATKDNQYVTVIIFEAFSGTMDAYRKNFDDIITSIKLAVTPKEKNADTITKVVEAEPPSKTMATKGGDGYSIEIPDNFRAEASQAAGTLSSRNYIGARRGDCNIQVDVIDATKQKSLKKIVDENSPKYKNAKPVDTKIGGQPAYVMSYSFRKDDLSRVYYVLKGNKLYKITMNWFKGEEQDYLPIFEKSIASIKFQ